MIWSSESWLMTPFRVYTYIHCHTWSQYTMHILVMFQISRVVVVVVVVIVVMLNIVLVYWCKWWNICTHTLQATASLSLILRFKITKRLQLVCLKTILKTFKTNLISTYIVQVYVFIIKICQFLQNSIVFCWYN